MSHQAVSRIVERNDLAAPPPDRRKKKNQRGLTKRQERFVDLLATTDLHPTKAYEQIFGTTGEAARTGAARTLRIPQVEAAIVAAARKVIARGSLPAAKRLAKLADSAKSEYVQADAAKAVLDRAGIGVSVANQGPASAGGFTINIDLGGERVRIGVANGARPVQPDAAPDEQAE